jgi:ketosteroid isomerase-like protein
VFVVVQLGRTAGVVRATGQRFDVPECHLWKVVGGKAVEARCYIDSPAMLEALAAP